MQEAVTGKPVTGAASELRQEVLGEAGGLGYIPWEALTPVKREERADVSTPGPGDVGASQAPILGRVFARTAGAFLGVDMPSVSIGEATFPVLSTGASVATLAKGAESSAAAGAFEVTTLDPRRVQARFKIRVEDLARLRGMEEALRADLREAIGDALDKAIINADGTAPAVQGFLANLTDPSAPGAAVATWSDFIKAAASGVDGKFAQSLQDVRVVVGPATYQVAASVLDSTGSPTASDYLISRSGGFRASDNLPAPDASVQAALLHKAGAGGGNAVMPIWEGVQVIRDVFSASETGEVILSAIALYSFRVLRADAYAQLAFRVAV